MRHFNLFYFAVISLGIALFFLLKQDPNADLSFYGFAESNETEINYNYPVVVDRILVQPGQAVKRGDVLMHISRRKSKEILEDQPFKIAELKAEETIWRQTKKNELDETEQEQKTKLAELDLKIEQKEQELQFRKSIASNLKTIKPSESDYNPLKREIEELASEKQFLLETYSLKIEGLKKELTLGNSPYREQIKRLTAEQEFEESQQIQEIVVAAPSDGLIGNIFCKEEEHIPSYKTLISFYEPHSGVIKGYVHEDLILSVHVGDHFRISSLKDEEIYYPGRVIGLGSRIVEIPSRLRKMPTIKSFGREVLIEITKDNSFLQKEKVSITFIPGKHSNHR